jgi:hypothetical protein
MDALFLITSWLDETGTVSCRDDRYKKMRGKKQWIEPVWIGPSESKVGNKKYKVRLDL